jgi:hypothetical protein
MLLFHTAKLNALYVAGMNLFKKCVNFNSNLELFVENCYIQAIVCPAVLT